MQMTQVCTAARSPEPAPSTAELTAQRVLCIHTESEHNGAPHLLKNSWKSPQLITKYATLASNLKRRCEFWFETARIDLLHRALRVLKPGITDRPWS